MGRISDDIIHAIRDRVEIVDLVARHVALRQVGRSFKGLCPFHTEKTPSFHVHPERQIFHCFGCDVGGDAFGFLMRQENLSFPEAVRALARECGIEVPEADGAAAGVAERLCEANRVAQELYRTALAGPGGAQARAYLAERGIEAEWVERFGIGLAPPRWDAVTRGLARARIPAEVGAQAGLLAERSGGDGGHYDRLRGRLVFPIRDVRGRIVGFGGRALEPDQEPKYLNTPESPLFRKREAFYGFPDALAPIRRNGRAVVVEGYFDLLALHRAGIEEALATCGTALTAEHARHLRRRTRDVVLVFDGDEAGERAVERALTVLLPEGLRVRAAALPAGEDPDSLLAREGPEALRQRVEQAPAALDRVMRRTLARGCATPWEKADAVAALVPLLAAIPDPVERGESMRRLALASDTRPEDVAAAVRREARPDARRAEPEPPTAPPRRAPGPETRFAVRLARLVIDHPVLGAGLDPGEVAELVPDPAWSQILPPLVEAARAGRLRVAELAEQLGGEAASLLLALAVGEEPALEAPEAERALAETLARLRERNHLTARRALTRQGAADPNLDAARFLEAKQRQLEERRAALGVRGRPVSGSP